MVWRGFQRFMPRIEFISAPITLRCALCAPPPGHRPSGILSAGPHPSPLPPGFLPALATPAPIALVTMKITIPNLQSPHGARMPCKVYPSRVHARHVIHQQNIVNKGNEESASSHAKDASCRPGALAALKLSTELTLPLSPTHGFLIYAVRGASDDYCTKLPAL